MNMKKICDNDGIKFQTVITAYSEQNIPQDTSKFIHLTNYKSLTQNINDVINISNNIKHQQ